jgi:hypothetical protein
VRKSKYIITAILLISITASTLLVGCAAQKTTSSAPTRKYEIVKVMDITDLQGVKFKAYQLRLTLDGGATFTVDLNLANGDRVDCYYITEKPISNGSVGFQVKAGTSVVYPLSATVPTTAGNTSDNFFITATQDHGSSYRFIFHNNLPDKNSKETIYTEIKYPANAAGDDSIFIPLETN